MSRNTLISHYGLTHGVTARLYSEVLNVPEEQQHTILGNGHKLLLHSSPESSLHHLQQHLAKRSKQHQMIRPNGVQQKLVVQFYHEMVGHRDGNGSPQPDPQFPPHQPQQQRIPQMRFMHEELTKPPLCSQIFETAHLNILFPQVGPQDKPPPSREASARFCEQSAHAPPYNFAFPRLQWRHSLTASLRHCRGCKLEPPKIPSTQRQPRYDCVQVDDFPVAAKGVMPVQEDVLPRRW